MFIIINGQLQGSNEIKVYESLTADLTFDFKGATFENTDTFQLSINNGAVVNSNYGFYKHGLLTFAGVNFSELTSESEVYIKISRNGSDYFADDFTVTFTSISVENDPIYTQDSANLATKSYVSSAVEGLATESYVGQVVSSAVAGLASESYVSSAVAGLASQTYVQSAVVSATAGLASESYVSSAVNGLASEAFVTSAISNAGHATTGYVDSAITNVVGQIDSVLDVIIGTSSVNELVDEIMSGTSSSSSSSSAVGN